MEKENKKNYLYYDIKSLRDGWSVECCSWVKRENVLFHHIIRLYHGEQQVGFMNLEVYKLSIMRKHMKTICENPDEYIGYTQKNNRTINWDLEEDSSNPIPFEVIWKLYPWIEEQLKRIENNCNVETVYEEQEEVIAGRVEEFTLDIVDEDGNQLTNLVTIERL